MNGSGNKSGVFLSYNSLDRTDVDRVAAFLKGREDPDTIFQDHVSMMAGEDWPERLQEALLGCRAIIVFFGSNGLGPWQKREKNFALRRKDRDSSLRIVPALLPGLKDPPLDFVMDYGWVDLRSGITDPRLEDLARALKSPPKANRFEICPFRGLEYFREEDSDFFFGREDATTSLKKLIEDQALVAVVGPSGVGKSSVVRAGLIPALRESNLGWQVITLRPGNQPFHALAAALVPLLYPTMPIADRLGEIGKLERHLQAGDAKFSDAAEETLRIQNGPQRLLAVIDQWEELYSQAESGEARKFIEQILAATSSPESRLRVVITLRGDFFGHALAFAPFAKKVQQGLVGLSLMTREELGKTITGPAERARLAFEPGLVTRILDDVGNGPGKLPLLQFLLSQLWNGRQNGLLTHAEYEKVGKVQGAISNRADEVLAKLSPDEQKAAKQIFIQLVRFEDRDAPTRRTARLGQFTPEVQAVIAKFVTARLLVARGGEASGGETVEIAHEALIENWSKLRKWVDDEKEFLSWRRRLKNAMDAYENAGQKDGYLLHDDSLAEAELWLNRDRGLEEGEIRFIQRSRELQKKKTDLLQQTRRRRRRIIFWVTNSVAVVTSTLAIIAFLESRRARAATRLALARQLTAQSQMLRNKSDGNLQDAALLAIESLRITPSAEADQALRAALKLLPISITNFAHDAEVQSVVYSPNGEYLATASSNIATIRLAKDGQKVGSPAQHDALVTAVIFSHDGKMFATASDDKTAKVWVTTTGQGRATVKHAGIVTQIAFDPQDQFLATASSDCTVRLSSISGGHDKFEIPRHASGVTALSFSSDGHYFATGTTEGLVRIIDASNGRQIKELKVNTNTAPVSALCFSPRNASLAIGSADGAVEVLDTTNWNPVFSPQLEPGICLCFSPDGIRLAIAAADTTRIWDVNQWLRIGGPMKHSATIKALAFSLDGGLLATAAEDKTARVWDLGDEVHPEIARVCHSGVVNAIAFKPGGRYLATASADRTVMIRGTNGYWEAARTAALAPVQAIAFSPDGQRFATAGSEGIARLWKTVTTTVLTNFEYRAELASTLSFNLDGSLLALASEKELRIWNLNSYLAQQCPPFSSRILGFAFSNTSNYLAVACEDGSAFRFQLGIGKPSLLLSPGKSLTCAAFAPDLKYLLAGCATSNAWFWDLNTARGDLLPHPSAVSAVGFSPDGRLTATGSFDKLLRIWDVRSRRLLMTFDLAGVPFAATFSPDSNYFAAAGATGTVRIWNCSTQKEIARIEHKREVMGLSFSPNGRFLATACADGCARLWIWESERLIEIARTRLTDVSTGWRQYITSGNLNSL